MERDALALERDLAHHRVARLVPQLAAQVQLPLERLVARGGNDRRHPLRHVHLAQALVGEGVGALVLGALRVVAVAVDQRRLVVGVDEALVAPHDRVRRRRPAALRSGSDGSTPGGSSPSSPPATASRARISAGQSLSAGTASAAARPQASVRSSSRSAASTAPRGGRRAGSWCRGRSAARLRARRAPPGCRRPAARRCRACASSSNTRASRLPSGALPTSTDGWRSSFMRSPSAAACPASSQICRPRRTDLPLRRARQRGDRERVQAPVGIPEPPQTLRRLRNRETRPRRLLVAEQARERRDRAHRSASPVGVEEVQRVRRHGAAVDRLARLVAPAARLDDGGEARRSSSASSVACSPSVTSSAAAAASPRASARRPGRSGGPRSRAARRPRASPAAVARTDQLRA